MEVWLEAVDYLFSQDGRSLNLILEITSPMSDGPASKELRAAVDVFHKSEDQYPTHTVAETIFPGWEYKRRGAKGVLELYVDEDYESLRKLDARPWGTYAERLLRPRKAPSGEMISPLRQVIAKMADERGLPGPKRSCYEVGTVHPSLEEEVPLYDPMTDGKARMGSRLPCLSHLSFKLWDQSVHLTATYRSHCYRHKVVGNLLGLARLQRFVADQVGIEVGSLAVHSTYAYLDESKGKRTLEALVADLRRIRSEHA